MRLKRLFLLFFLYTGLIAPVFAQNTEPGMQSVLQVADSAQIRKELAIAKKTALTDPVLAAAQYRHTLQQSLNIAYSYGIVVSCIESGNLMVRDGLYESASSFYTRALAACDRPTTPLFAALIHNLMGNVYNLQAHYVQASYYYHKAAQLAELYPAKQLPASYAYSNLATVLAQLKQYDKALIYAHKALSSAVQHKDALLQSSLLMNLGIISYELHNYDQALMHLGEAEALAKRIPDYATLHNIQVNAAAVYLAQRQPEHALKQLLSAAALESESAIAFNERNVTLSSIGDVYLQLKRPDKAKQYFSMAWEAGGKLPKERLFLLQKQAELATLSGNYKEALTLREQYDALSDSLESRSIAVQVHEMETRYRTAEKDKEIALKQAYIMRQAKQITKKNLWLSIAALGSLLFIISGIAAGLYIRQKNRIAARNLQIDTLHARLEGEEDERQRLAQELHDGIGSQLAGAKSYLLALGNIYPDITEHHHFGKTNHILNETAADLRRVAHNLLPGAISNAGITEAVKVYCQDLAQRSGMEIEFHAYGSFGLISPVLSLNIYRILQELLHNVVKHAAATGIIVLLNEHPAEISLLVEDNGKGMDSDQAGKGIGLVNIRKRVSLLSGTMQIEPAGQQGTIVSNFFPKDVQHANRASGRQFH